VASGSCSSFVEICGFPSNISLSNSLVPNVMRQDVLDSDWRHAVEVMVRMYRRFLGKLAGEGGCVCICKKRQRSLNFHVDGGLYQSEDDTSDSFYPRCYWIERKTRILLTLFFWKRMFSDWLHEAHNCDCGKTGTNFTPLSTVFIEEFINI
jgi:hypothetical protein